MYNFIKEGVNMKEYEIEIKEGHDGSSYFWIMPVKIIDYCDTDDLTNVEEYRKVEISIEEENVGAFLHPFLKEFFDSNLKANKNRNNVNDKFEWNLTHNYYSFENMHKMIEKINIVADLLINDYYNNMLDDYIKNYISYIGLLIPSYDYNKMYTEEEDKEFIKNHVNIIVNFYKRFVSYLNNMLKESSEYGYDLISFMGP